MQVVSTNSFNDSVERLDITLDEKYGLYRESVYAPDKDNVIEFNNLFKMLKGKEPRVLREDFCGIFDLSMAWVNYSRDNRAIAIDIDIEPMNWGKNNPPIKMNSNKWGRINLINKDCRYAVVEPNSVDISVAGNWSQQVLKARKDMLSYVKNVYSSLNDDGMLVITGTTNLCEDPVWFSEQRAVPFNDKIWTYIFEIQEYCPFTHIGMCKIHFIRDNKLVTPFEYPWRAWTVREYLDIFEEVGFERAHVMAHVVDTDELPDGFNDSDSGYYPVKMLEEDKEDLDITVVAEKRVSNNANRFFV